VNIFVGNLAKEVSDIELQDLFKVYGTVRSVKIIRDLFSGDSKGFGFVEMPSNTEAATAMKELNAKEVQGKKIAVNEARPKTDSRRPGGNGGSRGGMNRGGGNSGGSGGGRRW